MFYQIIINKSLIAHKTLIFPFFKIFYFHNKMFFFFFTLSYLNFQTEYEEQKWKILK